MTIFYSSFFLNIAYPARERRDIPKRDAHSPENISSPVETIDLPRAFFPFALRFAPSTVPFFFSERFPSVVDILSSEVIGRSAPRTPPELCGIEFPGIADVSDGLGFTGVLSVIPFPPLFPPLPLFPPVLPFCPGFTGWFFFSRRVKKAARFSPDCLPNMD